MKKADWGLSPEGAEVSIIKPRPTTEWEKFSLWQVHRSRLNG
jgi:hypothetical protein